MRYFAAIKGICLHLLIWTDAIMSNRVKKNSVLKAIHRVKTCLFDSDAGSYGVLSWSYKVLWS